MKVFYKGKEIEIDDKNFLASGGEGSIYKKHGTIFKVYHSPIDSAKEKKIKFLSSLNKSNIISPIEVFHNSNNETIGFTMKPVENSSPLALLFTNSFKKRNNITLKNIENIFFNMRETIDYIHNKDIIIVDGNELNYLISNENWETPYFIDVDSYQTKDFPATAIMPSIQDFTRKDFSNETDWYSFAVLMFQLYTGIHPYKGSHPSYKKDDIVSRCIDRVSVFNNEVKYPSFITFDNIPSNLKEWFVNVFDNGERVSPPTSMNEIKKAKDVFTYNVGLEEKLISEFDSKIRKILFINGQLFTSTDNGYYYCGRMFDRHYKMEVPIVYNKDGNYYIHNVTKNKNTILYFDGNRETSIAFDNLLKVSVINNRLFVIADEKLMELEMNNFTGKLFIKNYWNIPIYSSKFFGNCMNTNSYGVNIFYIPETKDDKNIVNLINIKELFNHNVLDCFYQNKTMFVISNFNGEYFKSVIKFDDSFFINNILMEKTEMHEINATVLSNGMSLYFNPDSIELSPKGKIERKIVSAYSNLTISNRGNEVIGYNDKSIYLISLKK